MGEQNALAAQFSGATAILPKGKSEPALKDVQVFSEDGTVVPDTHFFADANEKGETTITFADGMPAGVYLVYTGKKRPLAKLKKG